MAGGADRLWAGSMPDAYERYLVPTVFQPFADDLARRAAALGPRRVLELAAGTGVLTRALLDALPDAEVVATDLNAAMVELGRSRAPGANWQQADALNLPFDDGEFNLVVCQFGVMFFPDKAQAFAEAGRVLGPDGTLLFNTWDTVETHAFAAALVAGIRQAFPADPPTFIVSIPHGYADVDQVRSDVRAGGLSCRSVQTLTLEGRGSAADVAMGFCTGTPLRAAIEARADLTSTVDAVAAAMEAQLGPGSVTGRMTAHVVEATATTADA